ncbi:uncharacterized protein DUF3105 [Knoellia remsis]|uniref:Uncharacterized protein DUF3105 n=1 Tax=Knoellia remsis TaxID=407159 RepID=A0A2T0UNJ9_9MICO|nr:DUF3105 domain-containing protein [Knoellia remsis]PRY59417.1 uncharacterized protein DUF3105 [Knoellia remsis]
MAPSGSGSKKARAAQRAATDRVAQMRKEQQRKDRRRLGAIWGAAAVTIAIIVGAVAFAIIRDQKDTPSLAAVKSYKYDGGAHVQTKVDYKEDPPVGGEHHPVWLNCGVYDKPVPNENAVHSLEHGAVWITYRPDLPKEQVDKFKDLLPDTYTLLSPYEGLKAPAFISAWGKQLQLTGADDPRIEEFVKEFRQGPQTPEPNALCTNGTDGSDLPTGEGMPGASPAPTGDAPVGPSTQPSPSASPSAS